MCPLNYKCCGSFEFDLNLFDTIVWVIYSEPEISTHCNLRKHVNWQNTLTLRKQLHQSDNTCKTSRKHATNPEIIAKAENTTNVLQLARQQGKLFPEDSKRWWTWLGHPCCCYGLWHIKLLKSSPCIIHLFNYCNKNPN